MPEILGPTGLTGLLLMGCAPPAPQAAVGASSEGRSFRAPAGHADVLLDAVRSCGYLTATMRFEAADVAVVTVEASPQTDTRRQCVLRWISA